MGAVNERLLEAASTRDGPTEQHAPLATEGVHLEVRLSGLRPSRAHARESLNPTRTRPDPITHSRAIVFPAHALVQLQARHGPTGQRAPTAPEGARFEVCPSGFRPSRAQAQAVLNPFLSRPNPPTQSHTVVLSARSLSRLQARTGLSEWQHAGRSFSATTGSCEVRFGAFPAPSPRSTRCHFKACETDVVATHSHFSTARSRLFRRRVVRQGLSVALLLSSYFTAICSSQLCKTYSSMYVCMLLGVYLRSKCLSVVLSVVSSKNEPEKGFLITKFENKS